VFSALGHLTSKVIVLLSKKNIFSYVYTYAISQHRHTDKICKSNRNI